MSVNKFNESSFGLIDSKELALCKKYDLALIDLDGIMYNGSEKIENSSSAVNEASDCGMKISFVTNNASRTQAQIVQKLRGFGVDTTENQIVTSAITGVEFLKKSIPPKSKVLVIGGDGLVKEVEKAGFIAVSTSTQKPKAVIQGWHSELDWQELAQASYSIENGALFVATNKDNSLPQKQGFAPGNGAMVKAVELATGVEACDGGGKPNPNIYKYMVDKFNSKRPLVVGDRLDTDLAGAVLAGFDSIHILTGVSSPRDLFFCPKKYRPKYVAENLVGITQIHKRPYKNNSWWCCGESKAMVVPLGLGKKDFDNIDLRIENEKSNEKINSLRAGCQALWEFFDQNNISDNEIERLKTNTKNNNVFDIKVGRFL